MKTIKKALILIAIGIFGLTTTACTDRTWALQGDGESISTGVYVFYLMQSYQEAVQKLTQEGKSTSDITNEQLEGQSAPNWIVENALKRCKELVAVEKMMQEMDLSLGEEETQKAQETTDSIWESAGSMYENNFGINKESVHQASSLYSTKLNKIFKALYGKDGTDAVTDEELTNHYTTNYIRLLFFSKMPSESGANESEGEASEGESGEKTEESKKVDTDESITKEFEDYTASINDGKRTLDQLREDIKKSEGLSNETDPLIEQIINPNTPSLATEIVESVKNLGAGKATYIKFNDIYLLLIKSSSPVDAPDLSDETKRENILYDMKNTEFEQKIEEKINAAQFSINYNAVNQYNPLMFNKLIRA